MSTRGAIARVDGDGWRGVYQHSDSYPTYLGQKLWQSLHATFGGNVERFLSHAIDQHPGGWSHYEDPTPLTGPPTPQEGCYCHERGSAVEMLLSEHGRCSETCGPLNIEWVYVFGPATLTVFASIECPEGQGYRYLGGYSYRHKLVGQFRLDGPEPDWHTLEAKGS